MYTFIILSSATSDLYPATAFLKYQTHNTTPINTHSSTLRRYTNNSVEQNSVTSTEKKTVISADIVAGLDPNT